MKEFLAKWKITISVIGGVMLIVGITATVIVKAQAVATCEQVEAAKGEAIGEHKRDFAAISEAFQNKLDRDAKESKMRQRQSIQQQTWEVEDRMKVEGQSPYLLKRHRQLKMNLEELDLEGGK